MTDKKKLFVSKKALKFNQFLLRSGLYPSKNI